VLHFSNDSDWLGTLKIADLGLAKSHNVETVLRAQATKTKHGTIRYEAPQAIIAKGTARSRLYDIWSMGCIVLESVIWFLYGFDGLEAFWKNELDITDRSNNSLYFTTENPYHTTAKMSDVVSSWINHILKEDDKYRQGSSSLIHDLLTLVQDKLLVVALPPQPEDQRPSHQQSLGGSRGTNGWRTNSRGLLFDMREIVGHEKESSYDSYLGSAKHRGKLPILSSPLTYLAPRSLGHESHSSSSSGLQVRFIQDSFQQFILDLHWNN
jgi:serine/threonine protein kinase